MGVSMALAKITLTSGAEVELDVTADQADNFVAAFGRYVSNGVVPDKRTILDATQSVYIDFSKVAMVRREF
jgi:hypothetical protein